MLGISEMLTHYGMENIGIKVKEKDKDIYHLETPFIAHIGNDFVTVEKIKRERVTYNWNQKRLTIPIKEFINQWSGVTLLAETNEESIEPDFKKNKAEEYFTLFERILLFFCFIILIGIGIYQNKIYSNIGLSILLLISTVGLYVCYLLLLKQMNVNSNQADKICSLFSQSDCNDVIHSRAAKFMNLIGWSEIGFSYFLSNIFIFLFSPQFIPYFFIINIFALPYSIWSVWYQKYKAKSWCPLCLIIQLLFWVSFIICLIFKLNQFPEFNVINILSVGLIYGIPVLIINLALPLLTEGKKTENVVQEFNSLKYNEKVFTSLLKEQNKYDVDKSTSEIIMGNPDGKNLITVFTNPHCEPCAQMHVRLKNLLKANQNFCLQYILSSFNEELNSSNEFFIFINQTYPAEKRNKIYDEWFIEGKYEKEKFFRKYNFVLTDNVKMEHDKHLAWKQKTKISAKPTVLFNGYNLPPVYSNSIEKLTYFSEIDMV